MRELTLNPHKSVKKYDLYTWTPKRRAGDLMKVIDPKISQITCLRKCSIYVVIQFLHASAKLFLETLLIDYLMINNYLMIKN